MATGALAMATMAPRAVADSAGPSNPLQPVVDQLLDAQQQIQADVSQYPFVTPADLPMSHEYAQNALSTMLATSLIRFNYDDLNNVAFPFAPYGWNAPDTNMQQVLVYANTDDQYSSLPLSPDNTYTVTVTPADGPNGTSDVTFLFTPGNGLTTPYDHGISSYNLSEATPNADGSYTLTFSGTPQPGATNWVDVPANSVNTVVRDSVGNWGLPHDTFSITEAGVPGPSLTSPPLLTDAQIAAVLSPVAANAVNEVNSPDYLGQLDVTNAPAANTLSDIQPTSTFMPGPLLDDNNQWLSAGDYALQPDQALIIKAPELGGAYSSAMLANIYGQTAPVATATGQLNVGDTFHDPDGYTYYIVSSQNPGVANWLNDNGAADGGIWLRFQGMDTTPTAPVPVSTEVVNVADVKQYLPTDTPTVTPAEEAADAQLRLFEWDYTHDQNENTAWLGSNLEYDQIKSAVGPQVFDEIFGGQSTQYGAAQDVPTVLDRMTDPSLIPNASTLFDDIQTDPTGSLLALKDNLSIAANDIEMPTVLAALRLEVLGEQTTQAVQSAISSGQWSQALTDLSTGVQGLGTVFNETLTDPATSITAGILNARDDLAVSIMNAGSYSTSAGDVASVSDSLSQLAQSVSQALDPSTALADFSSLSTELTSQIASQGADLAPIAAGLASDLLPL
jgi:hypothetical protein